MEYSMLLAINMKVFGTLENFQERQENFTQIKIIILEILKMENQTVMENIIIMMEPFTKEIG